MNPIDFCFLIFFVCIIVELTMSSKAEWSKVIVMIVITFILAACGKDKPLKNTEYLINDEWRHCSNVATEDCGATLVCDDDVYTCMTNIQMRLK